MQPPLTVPEGHKRSRSASTEASALNEREYDDGDGEEAKGPIPFLTTLSMNQTGLFYGRKDVPRDLARGPARAPHTTCCGTKKGAEAEVAEALTLQGAPHNEGSVEPAPSHTTGKQTMKMVTSESVLQPEDTTLLHSMLNEIMDAAAQFSASASPSSSSSSASASNTAVHFTETLPACAYLLRAYFHFATGTFKPHQQEVCFSVLAGVNTLAVCPTGWGKSLCYQFPMLVHRLLFECRYEQWCRHTGVTSTLTGARHSSETSIDEQGTRSHRIAAEESNSALALPSSLYSRFCVVVSPLVALMEDQAEKINEVAHLTAFVLSAKVDAHRETQLYRELESPLCPLDIVFVSPEKFIANVGLRRVLQSQAHRLAMLCVDEVHCVSGWAYDFRPTFMYVSRVLNSPLLDDAVSTSVAAPTRRNSNGSSFNHLSQDLPSNSHNDLGTCVPYLCLTATATSAVVRDIQRSFRIQRTILCADQRRNNLELQVVDLVARHALFHNLPVHETSYRTTREAQEPSPRVVHDALLETVRQLPKPMLIYVQSRADADELSGLLSAKLARGSDAIPTSAASTTHRGDGQRGVFLAKRYPEVGVDGIESEAGNSGEEETKTKCRGDVAQTRQPLSASDNGLVIRCYHAALTRAVRTATQRQFLDGKIDVLVATVAFGMGIDKANIRSVVHAAAPSSLEGYVQEIGRAGRDGERSVCRILYNPFDFYSLRSRLWASLLSPAEMRAIVAAILGGPTTRVGQPLMLVSTSALSTELGFSEEAVETVLFLLLTELERCTDKTSTGLGGASAELSAKDSKPVAKLHAPFRAVLGSYPLRYKVLCVQGDAERENDSAAATGVGGGVRGRAALTACIGNSSSAKRRRTGSSGAAAATAGVGLLLRQLGATDAVLELCRVMPDASNQIEMANRLAMPLVELQQRMQDLIDSGAITVARYGVPSALLIELAGSFAEAVSPAGQAALTDHLLALHRGRLDAQVCGLRQMFRVLARPSHEEIASVLRGASLNAAVTTETALSPWSPPGRGCGKMQAVSIANAFVEENRLRLHSTYEALRALMGIRPKSLIQHGKYAGKLPLAQSWYVSSPYFGALRTFDLAWVLQVLAPHRLDALPSEK